MWVHGSVNLVCGEPGIESPHWYCSRYWPFQKRKKTHITAEESAIQIKQRAKRLTTDISEDIFISAITEMESIVNMIKKEKPTIVVLDSIQMVMSHTLSAMPGALNQVRLCIHVYQGHQGHWCCWNFSWPYYQGGANWQAQKC